MLLLIALHIHRICKGTGNRINSLIPVPCFPVSFKFDIAKKLDSLLSCPFLLRRSNRNITRVNNFLFAAAVDNQRAFRVNVNCKPRKNFAALR